MVKNIITFFAICIVLPSVAFGQSDTLSPSAKESSVTDASVEKNHSLYTGLGAGSNMIYLGTSISDNKPFYAASVTYGYKNAFFATASASHLNQTSPYIAFYNLAGNYSHTFNSWFDISADIAVYKTAKPLQDSLFSDFGYLNLTTGFDWKILYTRISFSGIVSYSNGFYLQISNSRYFETPEFFKGKALVSFDPDIDILFGNLVSTQTPSGMKRYGSSFSFQRNTKTINGITGDIFRKIRINGSGIFIACYIQLWQIQYRSRSLIFLPLYNNPLYPEPKGFTFYLNAFFKIL